MVPMPQPLSVPRVGKYMAATWRLVEIYPISNYGYTYYTSPVFFELQFRV